MKKKKKKRKKKRTDVQNFRVYVPLKDMRA